MILLSHYKWKKCGKNINSYKQRKFRRAKIRKVEICLVSTGKMSKEEMCVGLNHGEKMSERESVVVGYCRVGNCRVRKVRGRKCRVGNCR